MSHLFSIHYTGSQLEKKGLISNYFHFALNLWNVLPLPTSQIFFTFTLLGSSVLLQTHEFSEYHPFAQSQVVSVLSLTKLQQHGTSFSFLSVTHPLSVPSNLPWKPFSFRNLLFLQCPCPEVCMCARVWVRMFVVCEFDFSMSTHTHTHIYIYLDIKSSNTQKNLCTHTRTHTHTHTHTRARARARGRAHTLTHTSTSGQGNWRKGFRKEKGFQGRFEGTDRGCVANRTGSLYHFVGAW